jgi:predicted nucleic acid-binding protein
VRAASFVPDRVVCLDSGVWIKFLVKEEPVEMSQAAVEVVRSSIADAHIVAPAFAWAEIGSVLRKKVRQSIHLPLEVAEAWRQFGRMPIEYVDLPAIRMRAWHMAESYQLQTLYDAAFLACTEAAPAGPDATREFWTADAQLLDALGPRRPAYVRDLADSG